MLLIGDLAYYRRVGFSRELVKEIYVDDKISSTRILGRELIEGLFQAYEDQFFGMIKIVKLIVGAFFLCKPIS